MSASSFGQIYLQNLFLLLLEFRWNTWNWGCLQSRPSCPSSFFPVRLILFVALIIFYWTWRALLGIHHLPYYRKSLHEATTTCSSRVVHSQKSMNSGGVIHPKSDHWSIFHDHLLCWCGYNRIDQITDRKPGNDICPCTIPKTNHAGKIIYKSSSYLPVFQDRLAYLNLMQVMF